MAVPSDGSPEPVLLYSLSDLGKLLDDQAGTKKPVGRKVKRNELPDCTDRNSAVEEVIFLPVEKPLAAADQTSGSWWVPDPSRTVSPPRPIAGRVPMAHALPRGSGINWAVVGGFASVISLGLIGMLTVAWATASRPQVVQTPAPVVVRPLLVSEVRKSEPPPVPVVEHPDPVVERPAEVALVPVTPVAEPKVELVAAVEPAAPAEALKPEKQAKVCYNTAVEFVDSPQEAARAAKDAKKLMLVLTISGNFEESKFT